MKTIVKTGGVELCAETFGDAGDPALLLIMGSSASMDWWEDDFCARLAAGGRFVIRYDHRDTGESTAYPPGEPGYTGADLAADALAVLGGLGVERAHLAGMSMGGALAQLVAVEHPERVASLTLISTSAIAGGPGDLPGMSAETIEAFQALAAPDWSDDAAVVDYIVALARVGASPAEPFDEVGFRPVAERVVARTRNIESSMTNHNHVHGDDAGLPPNLDGLAVPTVVIHGADDPVMPFPHGEALAAAIPGARLLRLERTGHELPRRAWNVVVPAILEHTA